jgi:hypothetical protein
LNQTKKCGIDVGFIIDNAALDVLAIANGKSSVVNGVFNLIMFYASATAAKLNIQNYAIQSLG